MLQSLTALLYVQITRIIGAEADSPYDVVGANKDMSIENIKKRYACMCIMGTKGFLLFLIHFG